MVVQFDHPVQSFQLVGMHFALGRQAGGLLIQAHDAEFRLRRGEKLRVLLFLRKPPLLAATSFSTFLFFGTGRRHRAFINNIEEWKSRIV